MSQLIHLSRNFVEFGPFTAEEIQAFKTRGILGSSDFLKAEGSESWIPADQFSFATAAAISEEPLPAAQAPTPKSAAQKAKGEPTAKVAKKAAKKAVAKAAKA